MKAPLYGCLLAGGMSSRMGRDKASLVIHKSGRTQAAEGLRLLAPFCVKTFLSLRNGQEIPPHCETAVILRDQPQAGGPLAGILTAFHHDSRAAWLILACDLPFLSVSVLKALVSARETENGVSPFLAFSSASDGLPEPLCAIYEPEAYPILEKHAAKGAFCPRHIMKEERATLLPLPVGETSALENMNTPEELARARGSSEKRIQIAWFGALAEKRGLRDEFVTTTVSTAGEFLAEVVARHSLPCQVQQVQLAINDEFTSADRRLRTGDKVVFLMPFSGG